MEASESGESLSDTTPKEQLDEQVEEQPDEAELADTQQEPLE